MIDIKKQYRTRDGREVRIYATDGKGPASVVHGAIKYADGWVQHTWFADGMYHYTQSCRDLIEVKPRIKREVWVNVYDDGPLCSQPYETREKADAWASLRRIACVRLTIDCEEGEGL